MAVAGLRLTAKYSQLKKLLENWKLPLVASFTLGLAPFTPEPHIWGKLKWLAGGAVGMKPIDWFDLLMHGLPWVWLIASAIYLLLVYTRKSSSVI